MGACHALLLISQIPLPTLCHIYIASTVRMHAFPSILCDGELRNWSVQSNVHDRDALVDQIASRLNEASAKAAWKATSGKSQLDPSGAMVLAKQSGDEKMTQATQALGR